MLKHATSNGQKVFVGGNGGSAAIALHYVCDFSKGANPNWKQNKNRIRAVCLSNNISYMMAIANDIGWDDIFVEPLKNFLTDKDLVIGISGSGNSKNVVKAIEYANANHATTVALTGFNGGKIKGVSNGTGFY